MTLGVSHDRGVDETQVEILELGINLGCTPYQTLADELDNMFSLGQRRQERDPCVTVHPRTKQLVHLNDDRVQDDELSPQLSHERGSQIMSVISPIRRGDDGSSVGQNPQSLETSSCR